TDAVGTKIRILDLESGKPILVRWVRRGQGFGPVGPSELRFGLGNCKLVDLDIRFPSGKTRLRKRVRTGTTYVVNEEGDGILSSSRRRLTEALFPAVRIFRRYLS